MVCIAVPPKTLTMEQARAELEGIDNVMLFEKEGDMIDTFLTLIEDSEYLSQVGTVKDMIFLILSTVLSVY